MTSGRYITGPRQYWTDAQLRILRRDYPDMDTAELARRLGRSVRSVYQAIAKLGIHKSAAATAARKRLEAERLRAAGVAHRFQKGLIPWNAGLRRPGYAPGRMAQTQFKKGQKPHTWKPIGSYRYSKEGYLQQKVTDTGYPPRDWRPVHHLIWKRAGRRIPKKHALVFKNGDRTDIRLDNLECIHRRELSSRNHWKRLPKDLRQVIALRIAIKRHITMRERYGQQHRDPTRAPVRHVEGAQGQVRRGRSRQSSVRGRRQDHRDRKGRSGVSQRRRRPRFGIHPSGTHTGQRSVIGAYA